MRFLKNPFGDARPGANPLTAPTRPALVPVPNEAADSALAPVSMPVSELQRRAFEADQALARSDLRLRTALASTALGMWELDLRTDTTQWVNNWCADLNLDPCDGQNHTARWAALIHPDDRSTAAARLNAHLAGNEDRYEAEYRIRDQADRWQWIVEYGNVVERASDGRPLRMVGVCREIGARKQAEEALRLSEFRYRSVASMAPGYIFEYRFLPDGNIHQLWVSDGVQAVYGVSQKEIIR